MSKQEQSTKLSIPLIAAIVTVVIVIGVILIIVLDLMATARGRAIEDVSQPSLTLPLASSALLLIAVGWAYWLIRRNGTRHIVTMIATGAAVLLLLITPLLTWQALSSDRDLTVISMTCSAESLRHTGTAPLADCEEEAVDTIVLLEGVRSNDQWVPHEATGNLTRQFNDLPGGDWETMLTVDGPPDTVAVTAVGERGDEQIRLGTFRPYLDPESAQLRWSALLPVTDEISTIRVLFYQSENPAVDSASIRFEVQECSGQNIRTFDASACEQMDASAPFVIEKSPTGPRTWRHPQVSREGADLVITNLEARAYELEPDYASIEMYTQSTDVLIIPSAMPQTAENSISEPGQASFEIEVQSNSGELVYIMYVFPSGPTFAAGPHTMP